jgi:hypothetical protein
MRWGGLFILGMLIVLLPYVYGEELTEEFAKDYIYVSYVTVSGNAYFSYIDSDGDGSSDAVVVFDSATGNVRIVKFGTSEVYKSFKVPVGNTFALATVTVSGAPSKIVVGSKYLSIYNPKGELLWENRTLPSSVFSIAIADLNGDGNEDEIAVGLMDKVLAFDKNGVELWEKEISGRGDNLVALDLNQDGVKEVLVVSEGNVLSLISSDGSLIKKFGREYFSYRIVKVGTVDLNGDGYFSEIAVVDSRGNVLAFNRSDIIWEGEVDYESGTNLKILQLDKEKGIFILSSSLYKFSPEGEKQSYYIGKFKDAAVIDFNGDGRTESFVMGKSSEIYAVRNEKQVGYYIEDDEKISPYNKTGARALTPFDYDGDGVQDDLLVVNSDSQLIIVSHLKSEVSGKIVILANLIDYALATDLFEYLRNAGYEVIHVLPENFDSYKSEKNIIILGGHKAPEGVGEIVGDLLSAEQKAMLEKPGAVEMFTSRDIWAPGQRVIVLAGNTREETKQAHRQHRGELLF